MLRSLYSGISGMRNSQIKLDVIGNNIANSTTTGFKSNRVTFQDMFSQTTASASGPTPTGIGGINPKQVGLGVQLGAIGTKMTEGNAQSTGYFFDYMIANGPSCFFVVTNEVPSAAGVPVYDFEQAAASTQPKFYTKDGSFDLDNEGNIVTSSGFRLLGYVPANNTTISPASGEDRPMRMVDMSSATWRDSIPTPDRAAEGATTENLYSINIPARIVTNGNTVKLSSYSIDASGVVTAVYGGTTYAMGVVALASYSNPPGLEKQGGNLFTKSNNSGEPTFGTPGMSGFSDGLKQGTLEMSNVDLATEFTEMIVTSRAYQANARTIRTGDEMLQELINLKR